MTQVDTAQQHSFSHDAELIERIRVGETDVFLELIRPYERSVYLLAYSVLKNQADAEDAAQETVLKAFKNLHQLSAPEKFKSWLLQIAMNEARIRRRKSVASATSMATTSSTRESQRHATPGGRSGVGASFVLIVSILTAG